MYKQDSFEKHQKKTMVVPVENDRSESILRQSDIDILEKQWIEYSVCYLQNPNVCKDKVLKELNGALMNKAYLLGNTSTAADSVVFQNLYDQMSRLTYKEKEHFIHLSRWYNNLQHHVDSAHMPIMFSRFPLYH